MSDKYGGNDVGIELIVIVSITYITIMDLSLVGYELAVEWSIEIMTGRSWPSPGHRIRSAVELNKTIRPVSDSR